MVLRNQRRSFLSIVGFVSSWGSMTLCTSSLLFALSMNANAGLIFKDDFEKAAIDKSGNSGWRVQACEAKALMPVKAGEFGAPAPRAGKYLLRSETKPKLCKGIGKIRSELIGGEIVPTGQERWIGFSTFIAKNGISEQKPVAFFQLHYNSKGHELFNIEADQGKYILKSYNASKGKRQKNAIASVDYGVWTDWVFRLKFTKPSSKEAGYVQIWKNGKLVYDWKGHSVRNSQSKSAVRKLGQYVHKGWPKNNPTSMVMYHDEFRVGDQNSSYKEVSPGGKPSKVVKPSVPSVPTAPSDLSIVKQ